MTSGLAVPLILDTDVLIELGRGTPRARAWIASLPQAPYVSGFAAMEYLYGARNGRELRQLQKFLSTFPIVWPQRADLDRVIASYMTLPLAGGIGLFDLLIATTAIGAGMKLMTFNTRHFRHVPGLDFGVPYAL